MRVEHEREGRQRAVDRVKGYALLCQMVLRRQGPFAAFDPGEISPEMTQRMQMRGLLCEQQGDTHQH